MSAHELFPGTESDKIEGVSADINLGSPDEWRRFFDTYSGHAKLYTGDSDDLPSPIIDASIDYWKEKSDPSPSMVGVIELNATDLGNYTMKSLWHEPVLGYIKEQVETDGREVLRLPHETAAFHVAVSPDYVARFQSTTDMQKCIVGISLEKADVLWKTLDNTMNEEDPAEPTDPYLALRNFIELWSYALDAVSDTYGANGKQSNPEHPTITVLPHRPSPSQQLVYVEKPVDPPEVTEPRSPRFEDIAGYENIKEKLLDLALLHKYPEMSEDIGLSTTNGILLHGIPGTGKTTILKAFANEIGARLVELPVTQVIDMYVGNSAKNMDAFFDSVTADPTPAVVLIDEFDSLGVSERHSSSGERTDAVNRLKEHVVNIGKNHPHIILTAATNKLHRVDEALIRPGRFLPIEVPAPNERMRRDIWALMLGEVATRAAFLKHTKPDATVLGLGQDIDMNTLAESTHGMVGAHFTEILNAIRRQRLREFNKTGVMEPIAQHDLIKEIKTIDLEP
jgi:AAA+ superfamily predicted ATPase